MIITTTTIEYYHEKRENDRFLLITILSNRSFCLKKKKLTNHIYDFDNKHPTNEMPFQSKYFLIYVIQKNVCVCGNFFP
jgi:hypothetical protein